MKGRRRWIPRITWHRYDGVARAAFTQWFAVRRFWSGRLWAITVKHYQMTIDFRSDVLSDLAASPEKTEG